MYFLKLQFTFPLHIRATQGFTTLHELKMHSEENFVNVTHSIQAHFHFLFIVLDLYLSVKDMHNKTAARTCLTDWRVYKRSKQSKYLSLVTACKVCMRFCAVSKHTFPCIFYLCLVCSYTHYTACLNNCIRRGNILYSPNIVILLGVCKLHKCCS